ncbi:hypothetical protein ElyMa_006499300 [Elysia marginata]|uniref:Uncharacterized protein n=1 Tax=Elysia marginata TaxID=1093978 RepID=A0AAV4I234_9GAST|nr:hypothetical protein ElyMa_006499300 [Elysia marginata]
MKYSLVPLCTFARGKDNFTSSPLTNIDKATGLSAVAISLPDVGPCGLCYHSPSSQEPVDTGCEGLQLLQLTPGGVAKGLVAPSPMLKTVFSVQRWAVLK